MRSPVTQLDDRSFDDLVADARRRLAGALPELNPPAEGDPIHVLVDLFAFLTEGVIYRANLIPERQRQLFLNLLQLPMRPPRPAVGLVSIDAKPVQGARVVAPLLPAETVLREGQQIFTTEGEIAPLPLGVKLVIKETIAEEALAEAGITSAQLLDQYGGLVTPFRPKSFIVGRDRPDLSASLDGYLYLCLHLPEEEDVPARDEVRERIAGETLNLGLAPVSDVAGDMAQALPPRVVSVEIAYQEEAAGQTTYLPLEVVDDSSDGGRKVGVMRLRLPRSADALDSTFADDPRQAGYGARPPEAPAGVVPEQVMAWLRLSTSDGSALDLAYVDINAVRVRGQGVARNVPVGVGTGRPGQTYALPHEDVDASSLKIDVAEGGVFRPYARVGYFAGAARDDRVFRLDPTTGLVEFGDGVRGKPPGAGAAIRAREYRYGGGARGNLPANTLRRVEANAALYAVRQPHPIRGGIAAETLPEAEARIPAFLTHRARAVTRADYEVLARDNPLTPVARAEAVPGLVPGANLDAVRTDVPGAVSVFVLPPSVRALAAAPRPTVAMLRDVFQYLDERKTLSSELYVLSPQFVPIALSVAASVTDPRSEASVRGAIVATLLAHLWALAPGGLGGGWPMGRPISVNELRTVAGRTAGVQSIDGLTLYHREEAGGAWATLEEEAFALKRFQLPELMAVHVARELETPPLVAGAAVPGGPQPQPAPVAPDLC